MTEQPIGPGEQPGEVLDQDTPPGTPVAEQVAEQAAPVWCAHGVRWSPTADGWVADDAPQPEHVGHDRPCQEVGAIPCQPTYASLAVWQATAQARQVQAVLEEEGLT